MNQYPLSLENLACWEDWLNRLNHDCLVPTSYLSKTLSPADIAAVLHRHVDSRQNISYNAAHSHLSKRYVNDAWIWSHVLKPLLPVQQITELCGGASIVIDMTLSYLDFDQSFTKIDYKSWDHLERYDIKKSYQENFISLNVITETESIPKTDIIILNHSIDDLYIGLWNDHHKRDYWEIFREWEKVDAYWELAMQERDLYLPILKAFIKKVTSRLHVGGHLIIRDYPSAYETNRKHLKRINFTRELTELVVQELLEVGMTKHQPELDTLYPPLVQETFFVYTM